ncbi:MAG: phosphate acyltransferase [SAR324 cluster bacterium]|jgi:phosphate acetyltransferase|nr:phosphate acyltransferase [SAR324 cluster bacterium]MDP6464654.1 phosphate acyltransferase [SAR324 cluster bacterium]MDP7140077.1 phosphate acyltransferase [SAR324 cluster bacterium]HCP36123.1 phosphate acetyltransferase [Deltaproteobacteria bacterium]|tara:strand:+ start:1708 stop:2694 length:987 start_codon:yes stop_codon:yes gene_type:complete
MSIREELLHKASENPKRILFPEGEDERILQAAFQISERGMGIPVVFADATELEGKYPKAKVSSIECVSPVDHPQAKELAEIYASRRSKVNEKMALRLMSRPLYLAGMLLRLGRVDAMVAGATKTTGQVITAVSLTVGLQEGVSQPSSFFLMIFPGPPERVLVFADCALMVEPEPEELADIARLTAQNTRSLLNLEPRVALLSFSTHGSAKHGRVDKVRKTLEILKTREPDLAVDGELQLDAALSPDVALRKCPESPLKGNANVLIFPDLDSGNIGYKLAQYLGGAQAVGPVTQGFQRPVNDLSRGASVDDIVLLAAVSAIQVDLESLG